MFENFQVLISVNGRKFPGTNLGKCLKISRYYSKCSKNLNASCLTKWPRKTAQTQIRLLLKKQIRVFPVCYSDKHFVNSSTNNQHFIWEQKEKSVRNFKTFTEMGHKSQCNAFVKTATEGSTLFAWRSTLIRVCNVGHSNKDQNLCCKKYLKS